MASCSPFTITFLGEPKTLLEKVEKLVGDLKGSFSGDTTSGKITVSVPVFGEFSGTYSISRNQCAISVTKRPFIIPCGKIEAYFKSIIY